MAKLREEVPAEFGQDERWYKYFTNKSMIVAACGAAFTYIISKLFSVVGLGVPAFIAGIIISVFAFFVAVVKIPMNDTILGAGTTLDIILLRKICHRKNKRLYVKGAGRTDEESK